MMRIKMFGGLNGVLITAKVSALHKESLRYLGLSLTEIIRTAIKERIVMAVSKLSEDDASAYRNHIRDFEHKRISRNDDKYSEYIAALNKEADDEISDITGTYSRMNYEKDE